MPIGNRILIVGAGLFGSVAAHELTKRGHICKVIEKRSHIGGNCFTRYNKDAGCYEHVYGPHIFHTDSDEIWQYVRRFADFNNYIHRPKVNFKGSIYSFPINLLTLYQVFGVKSPEAAKNRLASEIRETGHAENLEDYCLSIMGETLYKIFIEGYTKKQWNTDPKNLSADIGRRLPLRLNFDDNYYNHRYQGIPVGGYTQIFEKLLDGIDIETDTDFLLNKEYWMSGYDRIIYTGPIDAFFGYRFGPLGYRSLQFKSETINSQDFQGTAVVNYTDIEIPWTRIIEHKHFDQGYSESSTLITHEFPADWQPGSEPFYPVNTDENESLLKKYLEEAQALSGRVYFKGRLGEYRYYDMDQIIGNALSFCRDFN